MKKNLADYIRTVMDFPKEGIGFKDITTLLKDVNAFKEAIDQMIAPYKDKNIDVIVGGEARGFIFAAPMAYLLGASLIIARKPGKLPAETESATFKLEYGIDSFEIHKDAIQKGQKVLIVDDLLATGGTAKAMAEIVEKLEGEVVGIAFLIELDFLNGREKIKEYPITSIIHYASET